jgi:hypothetical protein
LISLLSLSMIPAGVFLARSHDFAAHGGAMSRTAKLNIAASAYGVATAENRYHPQLS